MKERAAQRWNSYESFYIMLGDYKVADIVVTHHAAVRYRERVNPASSSIDAVASYLWDCLKQKRITKVHRNEEHVYLIDQDLMFVAEFSELAGETDLLGHPLYKMTLVTFLGRISEKMELRDLKTYYSWMRHTRRTGLLKNSRKRK
ncbi:hypothetical protein [Paenibacillus pinistramenti]|uniref:hypothetical protein n=1 Tax=Paenibacillus pinistramenti TaxID=1768003 RepID=UPI0011099B69|nr:hypothetical protein [Paenibacillus pinistramenti]